VAAVDKEASQSPAAAEFDFPNDVGDGSNHMAADGPDNNAGAGREAGSDENAPANDASTDDDVRGFGGWSDESGDSDASDHDSVHGAGSGGSSPPDSDASDHDSVHGAGSGGSSPPTSPPAGGNGVVGGNGGHHINFSRSSCRMCFEIPSLFVQSWVFDF
jgi:hypothetical protein